MDWLKNRYLDCIDLIDDHPHYAFGLIVGLIVAVIIF